MKANTHELLKFKRLQRRLGIGTAQLIGHLELLWLSTAKNAMEGDIGRFCNEEIAIACHWDGDPDLFVESLVICGWLDESDEWRLIVHDWQEHAPRYVHGNLRRYGRTFRSASNVAPKDDPNTSSESPNVTNEPRSAGSESPNKVSDSPCVVSGSPNYGPESTTGDPYPSSEPPIGAPIEPPYEPPGDGATKPNQTKPNLTNTNKQKGDGPISSFLKVDEFRELWTNYKRMVHEKHFATISGMQEQSILSELERLPIAEAMEVIRFSTSKGAKSPITNGDHRRRSRELAGTAAAATKETRPMPRRV